MIMLKYLWSGVGYGIFKIYRYVLAPYLKFYPCCRFYPSCSAYAYQALKMHGLKGIFLSIWRILRCNPLGGSGYDPVPPQSNEKQRFL